MYRRLIEAGFALAVPLVACIVNVADARAQELIAEGTGSTVDSKRRGPVLLLRTSSEANGVTKILADAYVPNEQYRSYPIEFKFFVNRNLVATQMRTAELGGPIGIDVAPTLAPRPFNYSIVATLLHPNRQFVTVAQGAVYERSLGAKLNCTVSAGLNGSASEKRTYLAQGVILQQTGPDAVKMNFLGHTAEDEDERFFDASLTVGTTAASGTVRVSDEGGAYTVTGKPTFSGGALTALSLADTGKQITLECNQTAVSIPSDEPEESPDEGEDVDDGADEDEALPED
jgi:hypothetical protein